MKECRLRKRDRDIESIILYLKADHLMNRWYQKDAKGDSNHSVMRAADHAIRWLFRMICKKITRIYFTLVKVLGLCGLLARNAPAKPIEPFKYDKPIISML